MEISFTGKVASKNDIDMVTGRALWVGSWEKQFDANQDSILVCPKTDFLDVSKLAKFRAIVSATGGALCHAAIIARELGIPAIVGVGIENYEKVKTGDELQLNMLTGEITCDGGK
ncbi:MAG: hypothetical protein J4432_03040 [DPANN group archaeon]|nr:hypothetical protein [DPANN group archaeon]